MRDDLTNVEVFNFAALQIFAELFDAFPQPVTLDTDKLACDTDVAFGESPNDTIRFVSLAPHAVTWLAEEGFLRYEKGPYPGSSSFTTVRLTLKGLTVLGYSPSALQAPEKSQPLISRIKAAVASGAERAGADAVKSLLAEVFKLSTSLAFSAAQSPGMSV